MKALCRPNYCTVPVTQYGTGTGKTQQSRTQQPNNPITGTPIVYSNLNLSVNDESVPVPGADAAAAAACVGSVNTTPQVSSTTSLRYSIRVQYNLINLTVLKPLLAWQPPQQSNLSSPTAQTLN